MAKKKSIWDAMPKDSIQKEAERAIEKTSSIPKKKTGPKEYVPTEELTMIQITKDARRLLKKIAAFEDMKMIEFISTLGESESKKRKLK